MPFQNQSAIPQNTTRQPAPTTPLNRSYRVALVYKNFSAIPGVSHAGLGVTAVNTSKYLRAHGIYCDVWGVTSVQELRAKLASSGTPAHIGPLTHVIISAPWLAAADLQDVAIENGAVEFAVTCHSNVPFLAADPSAFKLIRQYAVIEAGVPNFHLAGNSKKLCDWFTGTYADPCWLLPNLYYLDGTALAQRPAFQGGTVKVGCFGATRLLKNGLGAGAAALQLASQLRLDLEFSVNGGRNEGAAGVLEAMRQMFQGVRFAKLIDIDWQPWGTFRQTVRAQDLLLQPSFTESFNVVTADGVAEGVASVTGTAIDWVPADWKANPDDIDDIAAKARRILYDPLAPNAGLQGLIKHNADGLAQWMNYLVETSTHL